MPEGVMRKGLPFVMLALMIAALVVPVGSALSLSAASGEPAAGRFAWPVVANATTAAAYAATTRTAVLPQGFPSSGAPVTPGSDSARLLVAGLALVALSGVARLGR